LSNVAMRFRYFRRAATAHLMRRSDRRTLPPFVQRRPDVAQDSRFRRPVNPP
jgi:hypothetical protein